MSKDDKYSGLKAAGGIILVMISVINWYMPTILEIVPKYATAIAMGTGCVILFIGMSLAVPTIYNELFPNNF